MDKTTITEEFDKDGKLTKRITITENDDKKPDYAPYIPIYPYYPNWWEWRPTWNTGTMCVTTTGTGKPNTEGEI